MASQDKQSEPARRSPHFYGPGPYVEREADNDLFSSLHSGEYALVFAPRGAGKTSLRIRVSEQLAAKGVRVACVDLGAIGAETRADAFCASLVIEAARSLGLESEAKKAWRRSKGPPQLRLRACLHEVLLGATSGPIVLFIDELELVRSLGSARDDFFAALRAMADARGSDSTWARLSICLIGALSRDELVSDPGRGGFDLPAREITPRDFSREQMQAFAGILAPLGVDTKSLLDALHDWTSGNPALLQWLCGDLLLRELARGQESTAVEAVVRETFLRRGPELDPLLGDTARRLRRDQRDPYRTRLLAAYERVLRGEIIDLRGRQLGSEGAIIVGRLKVAGLVAASAGGKLRVRNRIIERVFDRNWVRRALAGRPVSDALERWESGGRRPAQLLRGESLRAAMQWIEGRPDVTPSERDFVFASERARSRRLRGLLGVGGALALGVGVGLGLLSWQYRASLDAMQAREAQAQEQARRLAREVADELDSEPLDPLDPAAKAALPSWAAEASAGYFDGETQETIRALRKRLDTLELRLAIETAARAELLAPNPASRAEGLELALGSLSAWVEAGSTIEDVPTPLTRGLTANLPSAGDTTVLEAHAGPIDHLAIAARGSHIVSTSGGEIRVWERDTGRRVASLTNLGRDIAQLAVSPSARHLAALSSEGSLMSWTLAEGEDEVHGPAPLHAPPNVPMPLAPIASISIDEAGLVSLTRRDGSLDSVAPAQDNAITRLEASALPRELPFARAAVAETGLAAETRVALLNAGLIELWEVSTGSIVASVAAPALAGGTRSEAGDAPPPAGEPAAEASIEISAMLATPGAAELLILVDGANALQVWDSASGTLRSLASQDQPIACLALSSDSALLATGGEDGSARVWNIVSGKLLASLPAHDDALTSLAFTPDGAALVVGDRSGELRTHPLVLSDTVPLPLRAATLAPSGLAASVHSDGEALELRWSGGQTSARWPMPRPLAEARVSVDGSRLALRYADGELRLLSGAGGPAAEPIAKIDEQVLDIELSVDGALLAAASETRKITLFSGEGRVIATLSGHEAPVDRLALSPDASRLASLDRSHVVRVWDPGTAALIATLTLELQPTELALTGDHLLVIDDRGAAELWSVSTGERLAQLELGPAGVRALVVAEGGAWFALARSAAPDAPARVELWRPDMPEAIASFRARGPVTALRFVDEGRTLMAVDGRGQLARWPAAPREWVVEACATLPSGSVIPSVCDTGDDR